MKDDVELMNCPCCGAPAILQKEAKCYNRKLKKKIRYTRVLCTDTMKFNYHGRCGLKTVAMPHPMAVESWNRRKESPSK